MPSLLKSTCLSPKRSLRTQLFSSFGLAALISLFVVVLSSCLAIRKSGDDVKRYSEELMKAQVQTSLVRSGELVAEKYNSRIANVEETLQLLVEAVRDRIVGYPTMEGWEDGRYVPFRDYYYTVDTPNSTSTSTNTERQEFKYPLSEPPARLDWEVQRENKTEYSDARISEYGDMLYSTASASYHMPGICDPDSQTSAMICTEESNNVASGGIFPSETHEGLYGATGDLAVFMKPLYEADSELLQLQVVFFNEGAGSTLKFPAGPVAPLTSTYESSGCDWIVELTNPYTGRPYGTPEQASKCRSGTKILSRHYNSMESGTPEFVLSGGDNAKSPSSESVYDTAERVVWSKPLLTSDNSTVVLRAGKAIFDRLTNELIGIAIADVLESSLARYLENRVLNVDSYGSVVNIETGCILTASPNANDEVSNTLPEFEELRDGLIYGLETYMRELNTTTGEDEMTPQQPAYIRITPSGDIVTASLVPVPPRDQKDFRDYKPVAFVLQSMPKEVFAVVDNVASDIDSDVQQAMGLTIGLGVFGLCLIVAILAGMSAVLTRPLNFVTKVANQVINNDLGDGDEDEEKSTNFNPFANTEALLRCMPNTEVVYLVDEFQEMIHCFSGAGASKVAEPPLVQIKNELPWHSDFAKLYDRQGLSKKSFRQTSIGTEADQTESLSSRDASSSLGALPILEMEEATDQQDGDSDRSRFSGEPPPSGVALGQCEESPMFRAIILQQPPGGESSDSDGAEDNDFAQREQPTGVPSAPVATPTTRNPAVRFALERPAPYSQRVVPAPAKINRSPVLGAPKSQAKPMLEREHGAVAWTRSICRSSLFWWIVLLMAVPILVTNLLIGAIVSTSVTGTIPLWTLRAEEASNNIEWQNLQFIAERKASTISTMVQGSVRDLHLMTRMTNWLVFGGIQRSDSLTEVDSASEECKVSVGEGEQCPFYTLERMPCACDWECPQEDSSPSGCQTFDETIDTRYLQRQNFLVQSADADPDTGNRETSPGFPDHCYSPETTHWWKEIRDLPGAAKGPAEASGYKTVYDRVAVSSACSAFNFPSYNYATSLRRRKPFLGGYVAFNDDGLFQGWTGCRQNHIALVGFQSTIENGATLVDPQLCPEGKFGYDPRCRDWYAIGREKYTNNSAPVHVTAPYQFASEAVIASSITSVIANPSSGEYVGQVLFDYLPLGVTSSVRALSEPLSFLITPSEDVLGGDTVVGPNKTDGWESSSIGDQLFAYEHFSPKHREKFETEILPAMKAGLASTMKFLRTKSDATEEEICLAFAPISVQVMLGMDPSNFAEGVRTTVSLVYSVGIGRPCSDIKKPFDTVEGDVNQELESIGLVYILINVCATLLFIMFSVVAAAHIAMPMIRLLNIVVDSNRKGGSENLPPLEEGCREVQGVYNTFSKFNKIVRVSNTAFFSGDLDMAHHFVTEALALFRAVNDQKAIGIACNNLANTLFAIRFEQGDEMECCDDETTCSIAETLALYDEAVSSGRNSFEEALDDSTKAAFAMQLSDRLFNRGLFLVFIDGYKCAPADSRERGYADVTTARDLHYDVKEYMLAHRQIFANAAPYFGRLLRRVNCLAAFYDDIGLREIWDAELLLDEADQLATTAADVASKGSCPLFRDVNQTGRRQQLESTAILLALKSEDYLHAAKLGMRMLVEDSFLLEPSFARSAESLLEIMKDEDMNFSKNTISRSKHSFRSMLKSCRKVSLDTGKNAIFAFELGPKWSDSPVMDQLNEACLELYDACFSPDDQIGIVANNVGDDMTVELGSKYENEGRQRAFIDVATSSYTSQSILPSFPTGLQLLIESNLSFQSDSYVILVTDGSSTDLMDVRGLQENIRQLNSERDFYIHLLIVGLGIHDERCRGILEDLGDVSKSSVYVDAAPDDLQQAFYSIAAALVGQVCNEFISFLTMERF